jgi:hypothetical protein
MLLLLLALLQQLEHVTRLGDSGEIELGPDFSRTCFFF